MREKRRYFAWEGRYEHTRDGHNKFWEIRYEGNAQFSVSYGKIGGTPQNHTYEGAAVAEKKIREKLMKGYVKVRRRRSVEELMAYIKVSPKDLLDFDFMKELESL